LSGFDEYCFEIENILNSPDRSKNPLLWRKPKAKIVAHSGTKVILKNYRSAPKKKKLPKVGQLLVCWTFRSKFGISDSHHFTS
jgi:hypothetical protein